MFESEYNNAKVFEKIKKYIEDEDLYSATTEFEHYVAGNEFKTLLSSKDGRKQCGDMIDYLKEKQVLPYYYSFLLCCLAPFDTKYLSEIREIIEHPDKYGWCHAKTCDNLCKYWKQILGDNQDSRAQLASLMQCFPSTPLRSEEFIFIINVFVLAKHTLPTIPLNGKLKESRKRLACALWKHLGPKIFMALYGGLTELAKELDHTDQAFSFLQKQAIVKAKGKTPSKQAKQNAINAIKKTFAHIKRGEIQCAGGVTEEAQKSWPAEAELNKIPERLLTLLMFGEDLQAFRDELLRDCSKSDVPPSKHIEALLVAFDSIGYEDAAYRYIDNPDENSAVKSILDEALSLNTFRVALSDISKTGYYSKTSAEFILAKTKELYESNIPVEDKREIVRSALAFFHSSEMAVYLDKIIDFCSDKEEELHFAHFPLYHTIKIIGGHLCIAVKRKNAKVGIAASDDSKLMEEAGKSFIRALVYKYVNPQGTLDMSKYDEGQKKLLEVFGRVIPSPTILMASATNIEAFKAVLCLIPSAQLEIFGSVLRGLGKSFPYDKRLLVLFENFFTSDVCPIYKEFFDFHISREVTTEEYSQLEVICNMDKDSLSKLPENAIPHIPSWGKYLINSKKFKYLVTNTIIPYKMRGVAITCMFAGIAGLLSVLLRRRNTACDISSVITYGLLGLSSWNLNNISKENAEIASDYRAVMDSALTANNSQFKRVGEVMEELGVKPKYRPYVRLKSKGASIYGDKLEDEYYKDFEIIKRESAKNAVIVTPGFFIKCLSKPTTGYLGALAICGLAKVVSRYYSHTALQVLVEHRNLICLSAAVAAFAYQFAENIGPAKYGGVAKS